MLGHIQGTITKIAMILQRNHRSKDGEFKSIHLTFLRPHAIQCQTQSPVHQD